MIVALPAAASGICNLAASVGGGTSALSPDPAAGWSVGLGQCNGDFTVVTSPLFPGGLLELGMRIEQRRVGPINPPEHSGINYQVLRGPDPATTRAWWNFQHSIAYSGGVSTLDQLKFVIRTDVGPEVPAQPSIDMLAIRGAIDDRVAPKTTTTFSDLYQTSQNPTFGYFLPAYSLTESGPGAWRLTLSAAKDGKFSSVSICAHTADASCDPAPTVYACTGFEPPMDKTISVKKTNRVLPLKMTCRDANGAVLGAGSIPPPIVQVTKASLDPSTTPEDTYLSAGQGTDGNEFVFNGSHWVFNMQTKNFTGSGTYTITAIGGGGDILLGPTGTFVVQ